MKLNREELQQFFSIVDIKMSGDYHKYYQQFGVQKGSGANFKCWNVKAHSHGDANPSMSIRQDNGLHHCFGCGLEGNFQTFWKSELKNSGDYISFMVDLLNLNPIDFVKQNKKISDEQSEQLKKLYDEVIQKYQKQTNKPFILSDSLSTVIKESTSLDKAELEGYVSNLLSSPISLEYWKNERNVTPELIKKYKIGLYKGAFVLPIINGLGDLINMKMYNPISEDALFKWWYKYPKNGVCPTPIDSLTRDTIYFFEGEPDTYCALGFGIDGSITLGSKGQTDVVKEFGIDVCKRHLTGKEIVIVMDSDEASIGVAEKLARSIYQFDTKQIKIINLDRSDINPNGLDPTIMKTVKHKEKRSEKDFTEFMKKNGFNENAKSIFLKLVNDAPVYVQNVERLPVETYRVTLQESRCPKYFSHNGLKRIEVSATICDFDESAFMYDKKFGISCVCMGNPDTKLMPACRRCMLPTIPGFDSEAQMVFSFLRSGAPGPKNIVISANDMLTLIETNNKDKIGSQKSLCGIDQSCRLCKITPDEQEKVLHVRLSREVSKYGEMLGDYSNSDIQVDAYIIGADVYPGKSYKMRGVQTKDPGTQKAVLVIDDFEPIATSIDNFKMDQSTHEVLKVFKKRDGECIATHLKRRYDIFGADAGVTGRHELFELMDYSFFSQTEINNKLFPSMRRGWVETLIVGESRSAKTMIAKFLMSRYRIGEMLSGSSAVTRSGLLGGVKIFRGRQRISWGAIPINDSGVVIIDELSNVSVDIMNDMTASRSDGIIRIDSIEKGSAPARTRKIMLSNPRGNEINKRDIKGVDVFLNVCVQRQILSRFDAAIYIMSDDVIEFDHSYVNNSDEFSEYQCNVLIMWVYSRKPEDVVYEDGIEDLLNECQDKALEKYHRDTQLVNQEFRLKLLRMATSVAGMLYSTLDNDWNKLYVKKEHVIHVMTFLDKIYCYPNMRLDEFSRQRKRSEKLGDMRFMENILKYISVKDLINENEFTQASIQQVFYDYLDKVQAGRLFMVDAKTDKERSTRVLVNLGTQKLIATMASRNCLIRPKYGCYRKTEQFANWLLSMEGKDEREYSDILEPFEDQSNRKIIKAFEGIERNSRPIKKQEGREVGFVPS
jgi:hypothetical protein